MDYQIFIVLLGFAVVLTYFSFIFKGGVGLTFSLFACTLFVLIGLSIGSGNPITETIYFDATTSVVQSLDFGISDSNILIIFILIGLAPMFIRVFL